MLNLPVRSNFMNINDLPGVNQTGEPEIFRLLKIGASSVQEFAHDPLEKINTEFRKLIDSRQEKLFKKITSKFASQSKPYKRLLFYPAIFVGSFLFFYFAINFPSLVASAQGLFTKPQSQQILGSDLAAYNEWMAGYFYSVSDKSLLSTSADIDHDGLSNYDEFIMKTNPTVADSDTDGTSDGVEVLNSTNPWGAGGLTSAQIALRNKLNLNMISERITYDVSVNQGKAVISDEAKNFDLTRNGEISIPKLKIQVPLIFSKDPASFDTDLEHGVIHYPGTALPGETGIVYVSGHSSDYIWKHDPFASVFTRINRLSPGDDIFVTVYGQGGKVYNYHYQVVGQQIFAPDDQTQFIDATSSKLNLSTCWPIGTAKDRMVVTAKLVNL
jgi:LPXTG-site transpeptidase (sortase) family protein